MTTATVVEKIHTMEQKLHWLENFVLAKYRPLTIAELRDELAKVGALETLKKKLPGNAVRWQHTQRRKSTVRRDAILDQWSKGRPIRSR